MTWVLLLAKSPTASHVIESALSASVHLDVLHDTDAMRHALLAHAYGALVIEMDGDEHERSDGRLELVAELRSQRKTARLPVFVVSNAPTLTLTLSALALGADDVMSDRLNPLELRARVDARIRRFDHESHEVEVEGLRLDFEVQHAWYSHDGHSEQIELTHREMRLLAQLMVRPGVVRSREQLLDAVWGADVNVLDRTIDVHVGHLRKKLEASDWTIETVPRVGYKLARKPQAAAADPPLPHLPPPLLLHPRR
jgi:DNA-binding response OmpR family regulator